MGLNGLKNETRLDLDNERKSSLNFFFFSVKHFKKIIGRESMMLGTRKDNEVKRISSYVLQKTKRMIGQIAKSIIGEPLKMSENKLWRKVSFFDRYKEMHGEKKTTTDYLREADKDRVISFCAYAARSNAFDQSRNF